MILIIFKLFIRWKYP